MRCVHFRQLGFNFPPRPKLEHVLRSFRENQLRAIFPQAIGVSIMQKTFNHGDNWHGLVFKSPIYQLLRKLNVDRGLRWGDRHQKAGGRYELFVAVTTSAIWAIFCFGFSVKSPFLAFPPKKRAKIGQQVSLPAFLGIHLEEIERDTPYESDFF